MSPTSARYAGPSERDTVLLEGAVVGPEMPNTASAHRQTLREVQH